MREYATQFSVEEGQPIEAEFVDKQKPANPDELDWQALSSGADSVSVVRSPVLA